MPVQIALQQGQASQSPQAIGHFVTTFPGPKDLQTLFEEGDCLRKLALLNQSLCIRPESIAKHEVAVGHKTDSGPSPGDSLAVRAKAIERSNAAAA